MKANELRIGNLILKDGIEYIIDTMFFLDVFDGTCYEQEHKPIPLTEEWFLKFGFEINKSKLYFKNICEIYSFELMRIGSEYCVFHVNKNNDNAHSFKRISNVHQLQNLYFALTGEELTVK